MAYNIKAMLNRAFILLCLLITLTAIGFAQDEESKYDSALPEEKLIVESETSNPVVMRKPREEVYPTAENLWAYSLEGPGSSLNAFIGSPVVLNFWAVYDRYSVQSMRPLQELQKKYAKKGLRVVSISIDTPENTRAFIEANPWITHTVLVGQKYLARDYGVWGLPTIYILDKNLGIHKIFSGYTSKKTIEKEIRKLF